MKVLSWAVLGAVLGAAAAFVGRLLLPHPRTSGASGYQAPVPARDNRAVLRPDATVG